MGNPAGVKRDFEALEKRRMEAIGLLENSGLNQSEVARRLHVCRQTVSRWVDEFREGGQKALQKAGRAGRKPELTEADLERLGDLLLQGPEQLGYATPLWTCARVAHLIEDEFGVRYHRGHVWKILDDLGWSCQRPVGRARERNEEQIRRWRRVRWSAIKKALQEGRTIIFIDESGISQRPRRVRTWSPRDETPVLPYNFQLGHALGGRRTIIEKSALIVSERMRGSLRQPIT